MATVNMLPRRRQRSGRALTVGLSSILLATATLLGAACAGDDEASTAESSAGDRATPDEAPAASSAPAAAAPEATDAPAMEAAAATAAPADTQAPSVTPASGLATGIAPERLLVVDVTIDVQVDDVGATVADVVAVAARHEGQVYGSNVQLSDPETANAQIVIKLPPGRVDAAIAEVAALGALISQFQSTDDVTDRVTDIDTRIITAQQSVNRVQLLLAEAENLGEVVQLEAELTFRQTVLEELFAQQRNLGKQTALATLTVQLRPTPVDEKEKPEDPKPLELTTEVTNDDSVGDAFRRGGQAFLTAATAVLIFLGYTAPFLAVAAVVVVVPLVVIRRARARRSRSAAPLLPPAPDVDQQTNEPDSEVAART